MFRDYCSPIDLICNKGMGSALMMKPRRLEEIVDAMTSTLSCPITLKMRTGYDVNKPVAHKLISNIVEKYSPFEICESDTCSHGSQDAIAAMMIHGRSRQQRYQQLANWDYVHSIANSVHARGGRSPTSLQIIGNGDIYTYLDYEKNVLRLDSRLNGGNEDGYDDNDADKNRGTNGDSPAINNLSKTAMIGRAALIKPWLPTEVSLKIPRSRGNSTTATFELNRRFSHSFTHVHPSMPNIQIHRSKNPGIGISLQMNVSRC